ncbi:unnamed protein product [Sphagnum balticum]
MEDWLRPAAACFTHFTTLPYVSLPKWTGPYGSLERMKHADAGRRLGDVLLNETDALTMALSADTLMTKLSGWSGQQATLSSIVS